jgi:hypothetical protein
MFGTSIISHYCYMGMELAIYIQEITLEKSLIDYTIPVSIESKLTQ